MTVNRVCGSGAQAIVTAAQQVAGTHSASPNQGDPHLSSAPAICLRYSSGDLSAHPGSARCSFCSTDLSTWPNNTKLTYRKYQECFRAGLSIFLTEMQMLGTQDGRTLGARSLGK
jgi:hypothetical protein